MTSVEGVVSVCKWFRQESDSYSDATIRRNISLKLLVAVYLSMPVHGSLVCENVCWKQVTLFR